MGRIALFAIVLCALACGSGGGGSRDITPPIDGGTDGGNVPDAGPDAGPCRSSAAPIHRRQQLPQPLRRRPLSAHRRQADQPILIDEPLQPEQDPALHAWAAFDVDACTDWRSFTGSARTIAAGWESIVDLSRQ